MLPSNVHRYLATLQQRGFVKQEHASGQYDLGPAALALGTHAMRRLDQHDVVLKGARALSTTIDASIWVAVWVEDAPVIVSVHDRGGAGHLTARVGARISAVYSPIGRVFLACQDDATAERLWKLEYRVDAPPQAEGRILDFRQFLNVLKDIRERDGLARVRNGMANGFSGVAAPVFDMWGKIAFVVAAVGEAYELDVAWSSRIATELKRSTTRMSQRLGFGLADGTVSKAAL